MSSPSAPHSLRATPIAAARASRTASLLAALALPSLALAIPLDPDREVPMGAGPTDAPQAETTALAVPSLEMQTWFTAFNQTVSPVANPAGYGNPDHRIGFSLPRARFGFLGGHKGIDYNLRFGTNTRYDALSAADDRIGVVAAWVRARANSAAGTTFFTVGAHQVPFSREMQISANDLVFQEVGVNTNYLSPNRDFGASVRHVYNFFSIATGIYNGNGTQLGDVDDGMLYAVRTDFSVGGDTYRTNSSQDAFGFGAAYIYHQTIALIEHRANVDLLARFKGLTLMAEVNYAVLDPDREPTILPPGVPVNTQRLGGLVQLSYYKRLPIGAIEPAVRFSMYDDATHLRDNGDVGILHAGVSWREPLPFVDVGVGYIHRMELAGRAVPNDTLRMWFGMRYPSRNYRPIDVVAALKALGEGKPGADEGLPTLSSPDPDRETPVGEPPAEAPAELPSED